MYFLVALEKKEALILSRNLFNQQFRFFFIEAILSLKGSKQTYGGLVLKALLRSVYRQIDSVTTDLINHKMWNYNNLRQEITFGKSQKRRDFAGAKV